ncbi:MAG: hypothetical protein OXE41_08190 [Gammaproteobacteria bacterium]|nr:hypothetical protein [Gammaproteobacteria bacterium]MCY4275355.1 hypothetical protein [Gammaproteobacteria bacterium]
MIPSFYYQRYHEQIAVDIRNYINNLDNIVTPHANSPRTVGDALESLVADRFDHFLGDWCKEYSKDFARRAMADMAFTDIEGFHSMVDVKTHRENTDFNMPNLTSVRRLARLYESDTDYFSLIMIKYQVDDLGLRVSDVLFSPIEFLDWQCLTIGALGWGQIQIANSNQIQTIHQNSRKRWMLQLCEKMMEFYPKEISKISERIQKFEGVREYWENKEDIWENDALDCHQ